MYLGLFYFFLFRAVKPFLKRTSFENTLIVLTGFGLGLYLSVVFGLFVFAKYFVTGLLLALAVRHFIKKRVQFELFDLYLFGFCLLICYLADPITFIGWDDFSHWALSIKYLNVFSHLDHQAQVDSFAAYIPGNTALVAFLSQLSTDKDATVLAAATSFLFFYYSTAIYFVVKKTFEIRLHLLLALTFVFCYFYLTNKADYFLYNISVDHATAIFVSLILISLLIQDFSTSMLLLICASVMLTLTKQIGFYLSVTGLIFWSLHYSSNQKPRLQIFLNGLFIFIGLFLLRLIWIIYCDFYGIHHVLNLSELNFNNLTKLYLNYDSDVFYQTIFTDMITNLIGMPIFNFSIGFLIVLTVAQSVKMRKIQIQYLFLYSLSVLAYFLFLSFLYRFVYSGAEAKYLISFDRYMGIILLAWSLFGCFWAGLLFEKQIALITVKRFPYRIFIAALGFGIVFLIIQGQVDSSRGIAQRESIKKLVQPLKEKLKAGDRVYFIYQFSNGIECFLARYELLPLVVKCDVWSIGKAQSKFDFWTGNLSLEEFKEKITGMDYVFVANELGSIWTDYGILFDQKQAGLFKLNSDKSNRFTLQYQKNF
jgi:hypothetical protein